MEITAPIKLRNRGDYPGDQLIQEISAASILAKVARDEEMILLDEQYPEYGLKSIKIIRLKRILLQLKSMALHAS